MTVISIVFFQFQLVQVMNQDRRLDMSGIQIVSNELFSLYI